MKNIFIKVRFFSQLKRMGPLGPLPWKVMKVIAD